MHPRLLLPSPKSERGLGGEVARRTNASSLGIPNAAEAHSCAPLRLTRKTGKLSGSNLRLLGASAQRRVDLLLGVVHEGLAQLARPLEPLDVSRQDHATRTLCIDLRGIDTRRHH